MATTITPAFAGDSTWLICKGKADRAGTAFPLVASLHEHRSPKGDGRYISVTLIYGEHVARGLIAGWSAQKPGALTATLVDGRKSKLFTGTAGVDDQLSEIELAGTIDENFGDDAKVSMVKLKAKLICEAQEP
jgi:hypothetical protein